MTHRCQCDSPVSLIIEPHQAIWKLGKFEGKKSNFSNIQNHSEALKRIGAVKVFANELTTHWAVFFFSLSTAE